MSFPSANESGEGGSGGPQVWHTILDHTQSIVGGETSLKGHYLKLTTQFTSRPEEGFKAIKLRITCIDCADGGYGSSVPVLYRVSLTRTFSDELYWSVWADTVYNSEQKEWGTHNPSGNHSEVFIAIPRPKTGDVRVIVEQLDEATLELTPSYIIGERIRDYERVYKPQAEIPDRFYDVQAIGCYHKEFKLPSKPSRVRLGIDFMNRGNFVASSAMSVVLHNFYDVADSTPRIIKLDATVAPNVPDTPIMVGTLKDSDGAGTAQILSGLEYEGADAPHALLVVDIPDTSKYKGCLITGSYAEFEFNIYTLEQEDLETGQITNVWSQYFLDNAVPIELL